MPAHWKAIVAMAENRVIGKNNRLPWHLPEDFRFFKQQTMGQRLVMGRKTYESIGRALPGRESIVLSRQDSWQPPDVKVVRDIDDLLYLDATRELFIIGGASLFEALLPYCATLYLTRVYQQPEGDVHMPTFENLFDFREILSEHDSFCIERHTNPNPVELPRS